jgi:hypothetical protein
MISVLEAFGGAKKALHQFRTLYAVHTAFSVHLVVVISHPGQCR